MPPSILEKTNTHHIRMRKTQGHSQPTRHVSQILCRQQQSLNSFQVDTELKAKAIHSSHVKYFLCPCGIKLEINKRKISRKTSNIWKPNSTLTFHNPSINDKNQKRISKVFWTTWARKHFRNLGDPLRQQMGEHGAPTAVSRVSKNRRGPQQAQMWLQLYRTTGSGLSASVPGCTSARAQDRWDCRGRGRACGHHSETSGSWMEG